MRVHLLQHASFEGPAYINGWFQRTRHTLNTSQLHQDCYLPAPEDFDALIIMGGPMGIYDDQHYPWLVKERDFIKRAIDDNKKVLGICLGSQLIADALHANVYANRQKEIGWFGLEKTADANQSVFGQHLPQHFTALHWHGDTFDLPSNCVRLLSSKACLNQAFSFENRVLALQCHLEMTPSSVADITHACKDELVVSETVQDSETITRITQHYSASHEILGNLLNELFN